MLICSQQFANNWQTCQRELQRPSLEKQADSDN
jgi:hypothetical protein